MSTSNFNFSFALIARNEEKTLPRLLNSIKYFLDNGGEVIVVDTGSTDNTVQVARDMGCIVHEVGDRFRINIDEDYANRINEQFVVEGEKNVVEPGQSLFDFSSARNYASSLASNDFVFSPDADEVFTTFDYDEVSSVIRMGYEQLEYQFVFAHDEHGEPTVQFMHCKAFDRTKLKWTGVIHEVLTGVANRLYLKPEVIKLEHFQNLETDRSGYLKGLAVDCFENPMNDRNAHYFGRELLWTGRPNSAIKQLRHHLNVGTWPAERAQSMIYIGEALEQLGDERGALHHYFDAYLEEGNQREPLMKLSDFFFKKKDWRRCATFAESVLSIPQGNFYASSTENYTHRPHHFLYFAHHYLDDIEKARYHHSKALEYAPYNSQYLHDCRFYMNLPKVSILVPTLGRKKGLERLEKSIEALNYPQDLIEVIIQEDKPRLGVPNRLKRCYDASNHKYLVYASNDMEFTSDSLIIAVIESLKNRRDLVAFNTGPLYPDEGNICEHFLIRRQFVELFLGGEIFDCDFHHAGVDNLLWAKALRLGNRNPIRLEGARVIHHHFSQGAKMDKVYELAYANAEEDRELLKQKLSELN